MPRRATTLPLLSVALTLVAFVSSARADFTTVPQTLTVSLSSQNNIQTDWGPAPGLGYPGANTPGIVNNPFVIQQFDHTKYDVGGQTAKLTSVEVSLAYQFQNTITLTFVTAATITVTANGSMKLYYPGAITDSNLVVPAATFSNKVNLFLSPSSAMQHVPFPMQTTKGSTSSPAGGYTDSTTLGKFNGPGTISMPVYASAVSNFTTDSGNGYGSSLTLASATLTVFYHYILVPEPASMVLMGLGCVGLIVTLGRGRAKARSAA